MEGFSILGLNLPFFVIITLLFSYLIWSKFLNKNKLKINDINNILDIFTIFTFLTVILISIISLFMIIFGILSLSLDIQKLMNVVPNFITFISL